jgi:hypothetical protein
MITTRQLKSLVTKLGGTLEEDHGVRDLRCFQAVAPDGYLWNGDTRHIRIDWATGSSRTSIAFNMAMFNRAQENQLEAMTEEQKASGLYDD